MFALFFLFFERKMNDHQFEKKVMYFFGKSKAALPRWNGSIKNL